MSLKDGRDGRRLPAEGDRGCKRSFSPLSNKRSLRLVCAVLLALALTSLFSMTTSPLEPEETQHLPPSLIHLPNTCQCQSLFTIGACDLESLYSGKPVSVAWRKALHELGKARRGQPISITQQLHELSRFLPHVFNLPKVFDESLGIEGQALYPFLSNESKIILNETEFQNEPDLDDLNRRMSNFHHVQCKIHSYSKSDIKTCLQKRETLTGKPLNIAFVGDSQVRNVMEQIVWHLEKTLNLKAGNEQVSDLSRNFLDHKAKVDLPVTGEGIELRLHWATYLGRMRSEEVREQGARDLLFAWARNQSSEKGEKVPDILYFDDGMWGSSFTLVMNDFVQLLPAFKNISRTTRLILRTQTPVKEWVAKNTDNSPILDLMNQIGWVVLRGAGVWVWDTITPHYLKEFDECRNHWKTGLGRYLPKIWGCQDYQHPSKISERAAANMIWNYVCNDIMNYDQSHCCSSYSNV